MYPNLGPVRVEEIRDVESGSGLFPFYVMRLEADGNVAMVPIDRVAAVGLRPPIGRQECDRLVACLAAEFTLPTTTWKARRQRFVERTRAGDVFEIAEVLKQLAYLDSTRTLGFADKRMFERSRLFVIAEVAIASRRTEADATTVVDVALALACANYAGVAV